VVYSSLILCVHAKMELLSCNVNMPKSVTRVTVFYVMNFLNGCYVLHSSSSQKPDKLLTSNQGQ
jgi:hypothetical protein